MVNSEWILKETEFNAEHIESNGSKFLIGNGYMGYRGTLEEHGKKELVALNMAGLFDKHGDLWRESVNLPNPFYIKVTADGIPLDVIDTDLFSHNRELDLAEGIHRRKTVFSPEKGQITVSAERFLSMERENICAIRYSVCSDYDALIGINTFIDTDVWSINGEHFYVTENKNCGKYNLLSLKTGELSIPVLMYEKIIGAENGKTFNIKAGETVTFEKICGVYWGEALENSAEQFNDAVNTGYENLICEHKKCWRDFWDIADIEISGDETAQFAIRYSLYHLNSIAPKNSAKCGIPARGLSGQVYKGAAFWDTEMFMMPFFSFTNPHICKNLVKYRINTLNAAKKKAEEFGFEGAFYPWESQETGEDACTLFNVTDIFTNRPMRTYFKDRQIHVSADMVYGLWEYCKVSGDYSLLFEGGLEMMYNCVLFYYSYAVYKPLRDRFELLCVVGPDEYHERVDNNAYTNKMVQYTVNAFLSAARYVESENPDFYREFILNHKTDFIEDFCGKLYIPSCNKNGIIPQFDGYLGLEDITLDELKSRIILPNEYLGGGNGLATTTTIIKQADVLMMLNVFRNEYSKEVKAANWHFYEPRTEHGSSLSACAYGIVASNIGLAEKGYELFIKTATVDLTGDTKQYLGDLYIGGTHPAANGGSWNTLMFGFAGMSYTDDALDFSPNLPKKWESLKFRLIWKGKKLNIFITHNGVTVTSDEDLRSESITVYGKNIKVERI